MTEAAAEPPPAEPVAEPVMPAPIAAPPAPRKVRAPPPLKRGRGRPRKQPDKAAAMLPVKPVSGTVIEPLALRAFQAGKAIGVSPSTMKGMISRGEVETVCIGRTRLVLLESLRQRLKAK
jgi:hypothetical protein